jgi:hypothetical protein
LTPTIDHPFGGNQSPAASRWRIRRIWHCLLKADKAIADATTVARDTAFPDARSRQLLAFEERIEKQVEELKRAIRS